MKPLTLLKYAWPVEVAILITIGLVLIFLNKNTMVESYLSMMPLWSILIGGQGSIAFGGPALKRKQLNNVAKD